MGTNSSKNNGAVIKTKVRAVGRLSLVRKQTSDRRKEIEELKKRRGEAISVFEDSSEGEISREDLTSLPLKNGDHLSDGEKNDGFSVTDNGDDGPKPPGLTLSDFKKVTRKKTLEEIEIPFTIPYEVVEMVDTSSQCHVCEVFTGHEVYPCRICGKAYHKSCLQKLGHCQGLTEVALLHSARMPAGWTCYICNDLSNLLTEEELNHLMSVFDKHELKKGSTISKEDFIKFARSLNKCLFDIDLTGGDIAEIEFKFDIVDYHKIGTISWQDFLNYQTVVLMEHRKKSTLVPFLTSREVELARRVFHTFDKDQTGKIPASAANRVLHEWYKLFYTKDGPCNGYNLLSDDMVDHARLSDDEDDVTSQHSIESMESEDDSTLTWEDYLTEHAIHCIAMRPNKNRIPVGNRLWLEKVIISYTREATLFPDNERLDALSDSSGLSSASLEQLL